MKAFPTTKPLDSWDDPNQGMDLRDYFAAQAMPVIAEKILGSQPVIVGYIIYEIAKESYKLADAMMKAREK
jgi:hypothetical protein